MEYFPHEKFSCVLIQIVLSFQMFGKFLQQNSFEVNPPPKIPPEGKSSSREKIPRKIPLVNLSHI